MAQTPPNRFHITLREMLAITLFIGAACASFATSRTISSIVIAILIVLFLGIVIRAAVLSGRARAFAIGFLVPSCAYLVLTLTIGRSEFGAFGGSLPTTQLMQSLLPPRVDTPKIGGDNLKERLSNGKIMMPLGHCLIAFTCGYVGGKYAAWIYCRQRRNCRNSTNNPMHGSGEAGGSAMDNQSSPPLDR